MQTDYKAIAIVAILAAAACFALWLGSSELATLFAGGAIGSFLPSPVTRKTGTTVPPPALPPDDRDTSPGKRLP